MATVYLAARNVLSGEERGETDVFAGYSLLPCCTINWAYL